MALDFYFNAPKTYHRISARTTKHIKLESNTFLRGGCMPEVTKMTSKGQVVIPAGIRDELELGEGTQMVVSRMGDLVLMKKISITDPKKEFRELTRFGSAFARKKATRTEQLNLRWKRRSGYLHPWRFCKNWNVYYGGILKSLTK